MAEVGAYCATNPALWLHLDGAFAGSAAVCPELRWVNDGMELVDSYCFNPHKWLLTNFDCSLLWVTDRSAILHALSVLPEYLRNAASESGAVIDYRDWMVPLGRRFRSLKLWMVIRHYGAEGLRAFIRNHVALGLELADWIDEDDRFERVAPAPLALVCFRLRAGDDATKSVLEAVNARGTHYLTHTVLDGNYVIRVAIGAIRTDRAEVEALWSEICERTEGLTT